MAPLIKMGFATSEFWLIAFVVVSSLAAAFNLPADAPWQVRVGAFFAAAVSALGFTGWRTGLKKAAQNEVTITTGEETDSDDVQGTGLTREQLKKMSKQ